MQDGARHPAVRLPRIADLAGQVFGVSPFAPVPLVGVEAGLEFAAEERPEARGQAGGGLGFDEPFDDEETIPVKAPDVRGTRLFNQKTWLLPYRDASCVSNTGYRSFLTAPDWRVPAIRGPFKRIPNRSGRQFGSCGQATEKTVHGVLVDRLRSGHPSAWGGLPIDRFPDPIRSARAARLR